MNIILPKDLIKMIEQLIIYEEMLKEEQQQDNFQYEYAYIEAEDIDNEASPTVIKISL